MTHRASPLESSKPYRAAIVGCGRIASTFDKDPLRKHVATHAGAYSRLKEFNLVAACDLDRERLTHFGKTWNVNALYSDFGEMLRVEKPVIVSICTWPGSHEALARQAVAAGVRAIFCEKPITNQLETADSLVELCRKKKVVLAVNHSRRWDKGHHKVRDFLRAGKIGPLRHVNAYYTAGISNTGTHLFDVLRFFLGDAHWVESAPAPVFGDKDLTLSGMMGFENNVLVSLAGLDVRDYLIFELDFYGSAGRLRLTHSGFDCEQWKVAASPFFSGYNELKPVVSQWKLDSKGMMLDAMRDLAVCLATGRAPLCTGQEGLKSLEMICAFQRSFKIKRRVALPLKNRKARI